MLKSSLLLHNIVLCLSFLSALAMDETKKEVEKSQSQQSQPITQDASKPKLCSCHGYPKDLCNMALMVSALTRRAAGRRVDVMHSKL